MNCAGVLDLAAIYLKYEVYHPQRYSCIIRAQFLTRHQ